MLISCFSSSSRISRTVTRVSAVAARPAASEPGLEGTNGLALVHGRNGVRAGSAVRGRLLNPLRHLAVRAGGRAQPVLVDVRPVEAQQVQHPGQLTRQHDAHRDPLPS
jgi:hypothetical protein